MKSRLLLVVLFSCAVVPSATPATGFDEFGSLFALADKMERRSQECAKIGASANSDRIRGEADGYANAAALVREEIAAIRALRQKASAR